MTTPAPTVRPPSRIAKRSSFSIAIGAISSPVDLHVVPRHHHLHPLRQVHDPRHVRRAEVELRPVPLEERRVPPALLLLSTYTSPLNFVCGVMLPGLASTIPRSTSSRLVPRSSTPTLSPARPSSSSLRNISTPVAHRLARLARARRSPLPRRPSRSRARSAPSPPSRAPRSRTRPRPTSGTACRSRASAPGCTCPARPAARRCTCRPARPARPLSSALSALPRMIGISSPGNSYCVSSSRTSSSTRSSSSGSSTMSTLFRNTTMYGTPTWRASRMCSRVCGIGPSAASPPASPRPSAPRP